VFILYKEHRIHIKRNEGDKSPEVLSLTVYVSSTYGERRGAYSVLVGKPEGRRPLGRPRHRW
jgi:hypothetical protein